jgi:branched-chain amino acid aminotransferase
MDALQMSDLHFPTYDVLEKKIEGLINKNRYFTSSRVRLTVFRNDGGLYTPSSNDCSYILEATPLEKSIFELNEKGLIAGIYSDVTKQQSIVSPYKTANSLVYVLAGLHKKKYNLSEVLIKNGNGLIIETMSSNLFWFKGDVLYTPLVTSGCIDGVMRGYVMKVAEHIGIEVKEVAGITEQMVKSVDELFVTNAVSGMQWIVGMDDVRFYNKKTRQLYQAFMESFS